MAATSESWRSKLNTKYSKMDIESWDAKLKAELKLLKQRSGNKRCFDCGVDDVTWACPKLGIFICVACSDVHRAAGAHIPCVKNFNTYLWGPDEVALMTAVGNMRGRDLYGAEVVSPTADKTSKVAYCTRKYGNSDVQKLVAKAVIDAKATGANGPSVTTEVEKVEFMHPSQVEIPRIPDLLDDLFKPEPSAALKQVIHGEQNFTAHQYAAAVDTVPVSNVPVDGEQDSLEDFLAICNSDGRQHKIEIAANEDLFAGWESWE